MVYEYEELPAIPHPAMVLRNACARICFGTNELVNLLGTTLEWTSRLTEGEVRVSDFVAELLERQTDGGSKQDWLDYQADWTEEHGYWQEKDPNG